MKTGRNITLDYFKLTLCFFVFLVHYIFLCEADTELGRLLVWQTANGVGRIIVPCFYMINGYFLSKIIRERTKIKKYIIKLCIIYITWVVLYFSLTTLLGRTSINADTIGHILYLTYIKGYEHLWYVLALIQATFILHILYTKTPLLNNVRGEIILGIILFLAGYIIQHTNLMKMEGLLSGLPVYSRNALFFAIPFILIGKVINNFETKLTETKTQLLLFVSVLGFLLMMAESYYYYTKLSTVGAGIDLVLFVIVTAPALFILILKKSRYSTTDDGSYGDLASVFYYCHMMTIFLYWNFFENNYSLYNLPILIFATALLSIVVIQLNKKIKIFF